MRTLAEVGQLVRSRRRSLNQNGVMRTPTEKPMTIAQAATRGGVSDTTWSALERGDRVSDETRMRASHALAWNADSIDNLLAGGEPTQDPRILDHIEGADAGIADLKARVEELEQRLAEGAAPASPSRRGGRR